MLYCTGSFSTSWKASESWPAFGPSDHFAIAVSTNSDVYAYPSSSNCVCSGPAPSSTWASSTESSFRIGTPNGSAPS